MKSIKICIKMKLTVLLSLVFLLIIVLRFPHVDVFNFNSLILTFVYCFIIEIYANLSMLVLIGFQVASGCCAILYKSLCVFPLLLALEPFSLFGRLYTSMFNQFCIDLVTTLREILFSSFQCS